MVRSGHLLEIFELELTGFAVACERDEEVTSRFLAWVIKERSCHLLQIEGRLWSGQVLGVEIGTVR